MSDPIGGITSTAVSGLQAAQAQADQAASNIAGYGATETPVPTGGPALTGTQPSNIAGAVQQASGGTDLTTQVLDLLNARNAFAANLDVLNTGNQLQKQAIDITA